ncbi:MAG TPA: hypothetical protein PLH11_09760 [Gemmobacter sp.]|nr:hypothetical protein [Gemmobacter sp.]
MTRAQTNGLALGLALAAAALGYLVPVVGPILAVFLVLVVLAAVLGDEAGMAAVLLEPFAALARWLARSGEGRWLRRAPVFGLLAGATSRWITASVMDAGS